jgi:hypothetical protein
MESKEKQVPFYKEKIFWIVLVGLIVFLIWLDSSGLKPMPASNMTVEERSVHDESVLTNYIKRQFDAVQTVEVNHERDYIVITTDILTGEQYSESTGKEIRDAVEKLVEKHTKELTIETMYNVIIKSKDGDLLAS